MAVRAELGYRWRSWLALAVLVAVVGGVVLGAAAAGRRQFPEVSVLPVTPANLVNFGQAVNSSLILGAVLVVFGIATPFTCSCVSVARRAPRARAAHAIGLLRHRVAAAVCRQATTVAVVGIALGVPIGSAAGRAARHAFAINLGIVPVMALEVWTLTALAAAVLVVANGLAIGPALVSAGSRPGALLPSE